MTDPLVLASEIERVEGGSAELSARAWCALSGYVFVSCHDDIGATKASIFYADDTELTSVEMSDMTRDLAAAVAMVPVGRRIVLETVEVDDPCVWCHLEHWNGETMRSDFHASIIKGPDESRSCALARALTVALLRAKAQEVKS